MPWVVVKQFKFEAAHRLPNHLGLCQRLHGHSYTMDVFVKGDELCQDGTESGMVLDFAWIKTEAKPVIDEYLDHHYLNETTGLENPTAEELARWVFNKLKPALDGLIGIEIGETCTSRCFYFPDLNNFSSSLLHG
jgi:6-pyruvoyltetrahydropterin/6-carboxytetrahydropterin synthase